MNVVLIVIYLITPLITVGVGLFFRGGSFGEINSLVGYRTRRSMSSQAAWDFAHVYYGRLALRTGIITSLATVVSAVCIICFTNWRLDSIAVACSYFGVQIALLILPAVPTERQLRICFDENGNRKK